jgi:hypothetical protein
VLPEVRVRLMPRFVEFERESAGSAETPMFTLQARGLLSLNHAAYRALGQPDHVALLYDEEEQVVGVRLAAEESANAHRVRAQGGSYIVGAQKFTSHYGIRPLVAQRFVAHDYGNGVWGFVLTEGRSVANRRGAPELTPAHTARWRVTSDGFEVPALMRLGDAGAPQPAWTAHPPGGEPASMRVGALIACEPLGSSPPTPALGQSFLHFMGTSPGVMDLIKSVTHVHSRATWTRWAGNGRMMLEAGLTPPRAADEEPRTVVAWARLLLPQVVQSGFGRDPRFAELILHLNPQTAGGGPPVPADIRTWHERFTKALSIPAILATFLEDTLELKTSDDPPAQLGIQLKAPHNMADLVDFEGLTVLEGSQPSPWYMGWTVADRVGQPTARAASELLRNMFDYTLHVDEYEKVLAALAE